MTVRTQPPTRPPTGINDVGWWRQLLDSIYHIWQRLNQSQLDIGGATIYVGTGTPESNQAGNVGDLFLRTDGGASTTLYVKESGTGDTGWIAK